jgi:hypothetical protein
MLYALIAFFDTECGRGEDEHAFDWGLTGDSLEVLVVPLGMADDLK